LAADPTLHDRDRARERFGIAAEAFFRRLEVTIGMALAAVAEVIDHDLVADAGHDILQHAPARLVKHYVVGDDGGDAHLHREVG
jgi:hypothetical protein